MDILLERIVNDYQKNNKNASKRIYLRLYETLRNGILNNDYPVGNHLPSTRVLASTLRISRSSVMRSYELLGIEGYINSKQGSGYAILDILKKNEIRKVPISADKYAELSNEGKSFLANINLINPTDDKSIAFRPGLPPLDIFPVNLWKNLSNLYWRNIKTSTLSYYPSSGIESLKKSLASYLNISRNLKCNYHQIIIVSGSLQSLFLIGKVLINIGDTVYMENPTFPNVHTIFRSLNAHIVGLEMDLEGAIVPSKKKKTTVQPKLIHVTPSAHYPSGVPMSLTRKHEILEWAAANKSFIIENDYEHDVIHRNQKNPSLFSLDNEDRTIYLGTFNRVLHPSIRLGYMIVPNHLINAVQALQKLSHRFISPSIQIVMNQFIEKKMLMSHIKNVQQAADERRKTFIHAFNIAFKGKLTIAELPSDVLHLLIELPPEVAESKYISILQDQKIVVHPYSKCFIHGPVGNGIIVGFSSVRTPAMKKKIQLMADLFFEHF